MAVDAVEEQLDAAVDVIRRGLADAEIVGLYLYGSAVAGVLRPDSDLDLFVVTDRRLMPGEKAWIVEGLLRARRSVRRSGPCRAVSLPPGQDSDHA